MAPPPSRSDRNVFSSRHCSGVTSDENTQLSVRSGRAGPIRASRNGLPDSDTSQPSTSKSARASCRSPGAYIAATWCSLVASVELGVGVAVIPSTIDIADVERHRGAHYSGVTYAPLMPPSTRNVEAVMNEASSLARNATAAAISSGSAKRPMGTWTRRRAARSGSLANNSFSMRGVHRSRAQGIDADTVAGELHTELPRHGQDAAFAGGVGDLRGGRAQHRHERSGVDDRTARSSMWVMAYFEQRYTDVRLTSCTRRQASTPVVKIESSSGGEIPALLKLMSTLPNSSTTAWYRA